MIYLKDKEFEYIVKLMKSTYGVNLSSKRPLIEGRLSNYIASLGYNNYMDYFKFAQEHPDELVSIVNKLTTNHTYFMRENEHFAFYSQNVLPWIDKELQTKDLRVWSAGCSSGQEPYTLAIITQNYLGSRASSWESTILASDISNRVLDIAKEGKYPKEDLSKMPQEWTKKYFKEVDSEHMQVIPALRNKVAYRYFNLLDPFRFKQPFQAIFCRNVMIYFDNETKTNIINKFYDALLPGGYLFIGQSESLSGIQSNFRYVKPSIYRK